MLIAALTSVGAAVLLGAALAVLYLRGQTAAPVLLTALHGLFGLGGLACVLVALRGPPRGLEHGTGSFGAISATLLGLAALVGLGVFFIHRVKRRRGGTLIGLHATLAVSGFVVLAAYLLA